jgi:flagellar biosynthetic protein FliR
MQDWSQYAQAWVLVLLRLSGLMVFGPVFSSVAIAPRIKAGFVVAMTFLLAPVVTAVPNARASLSMAAVLGELGVGLLFGLSLMLLTESIAFAGALLSMEFSFSLVNLMDPNSMVQTLVLGELLSWLNLLVLIGAGLDRSLIAALVRSFCVVPVGHAVVYGRTGAELAAMAGGIFLAGLQLAAPVIAAVFVVEVSIALMARMSPQLPAMIVGIPLKTLVAYLVLLTSLSVWPGWIERHFTGLLDEAQRLMTGA